MPKQQSRRLPVEKYTTTTGAGESETNTGGVDNDDATLQSMERLSEELSRVNSSRPFACVRSDNTADVDADAGDWGEEEGEDKTTACVEINASPQHVVSNEISMWAEGDDELDDLELHLEGKISNPRTTTTTTEPTAAAVTACGLAQWSEGKSELDENTDWAESSSPLDNSPLVFASNKNPSTGTTMTFDRESGRWEGGDPVDVSGFESDPSEEEPMRRRSLLQKSHSIAPECLPKDDPVTRRLDQSNTSTTKDNERPSPVTKGNRPRSESANAAMHRPRFSSKRDFEISTGARAKFETSEKAHARLLQSWQHTTDGLRQKMCPPAPTQKCRRALIGSTIASPKRQSLSSSSTKTSSAAAGVRRARASTTTTGQLSEAERQRRVFLRQIKEMTLDRLLENARRLNQFEKAAKK